jgi:phosphoglucosamine mutase
LTVPCTQSTITTMKLFGSSGIRRIADRSLLEIAVRTGLGLSQLHKTAVIARDTRTSGNALKYGLISGLLSGGARCYDAGTVPTPTLAFAARDAEVGVMITASHNPPQYNGIKVFNPDGSSYVQAQQSELERIISGTLPTSPWEEMQTECLSCEDAVSQHMAHIMDQVEISGPLKVVVDCNCGAAAVITPYLLTSMGCSVVGLNTHPSGIFPHNPEPVEENLDDVRQVCRQLGTVGVVHDGDADRMMAVDEMGRFIDGDRLLILLARQTRATQVVTTVDASMSIEDSGLHTVRTRVGDTFVSEQLRLGGDFGGEPSGAWVFPGNSLCPDGIFAAAMLASIASRHKISKLVDEIPRYPILRGSIPGSGMPDAEELGARIKAGAIDRTDGAKFTFGDGWVLIRPSGTEPKIRITAEARTEERARELYDSASTALKTMADGGKASR